MFSEGPQKLGRGGPHNVGISALFIAFSDRKSMYLGPDFLLSQEIDISVTDVG